MRIITIESKLELETYLEKEEKVWCLLYKKGSRQSDCAHENLTAAVEAIENTILLIANVSKVRDIHTAYAITSAPSLMEFEAKQMKNVIKGCQSTSFYKNLIEESLFRTEMKKDGKSQKPVTVYSTPTCSWCNTLKSHLRHHRILYTDIDVSQNQEAAKAMVQRSGQQGVPQTLIGNELIIGFDKKRINELLNINN